VLQLGGKLRLTAESLDARKVTRQCRVQHLERHFPFEMEVARTIDASEPATPDGVEQFVVVAQRAAQELLPFFRVIGRRVELGPGRPHRYRLDGTRLGCEVLQHLPGRQVAPVGFRAQRAHDDAL
jgi:hypothetical protein